MLQRPLALLFHKGLLSWRPWALQDIPSLSQHRINICFCLRHRWRLPWWNYSLLAIHCPLAFSSQRPVFLFSWSFTLLHSTTIQFHRSFGTCRRRSNWFSWTSFLSYFWIFAPEPNQGFLGIFVHLDWSHLRLFQFRPFWNGYLPFPSWSLPWWTVLLRFIRQADYPWPFVLPHLLFHSLHYLHYILSFICVRQTLSCISPYQLCLSCLLLAEGTPWPLSRPPAVPLDFYEWLPVYMRFSIFSLDCLASICSRIGFHPLPCCSLFPTLLLWAISSYFHSIIWLFRGC